MLLLPCVAVAMCRCCYVLLLCIAVRHNPSCGIAGVVIVVLVVVVVVLAFVVAAVCGSL